MIGGLLYVLYNMVFKKPQIQKGEEDMKINDQGDTDDGEYVDYEEVD